MPSPLATSASGKYRCTTCDKVYSTNSHLRRHEATHTGRHDLTCPFCQTHFTRRDLARRHIEKCSARDHEVVVPTAKRGRRRISCDKCSQRKLSCDAKTPCMRCRSSDTLCTYGRLGLAHPSTNPHIVADVHPSDPVSRIVEANASRERISIEFLLNFTNPSGFRPSAAIAAEAADLNAGEDDAYHQSAGLQSDGSFPLQNHPFFDLGDLSSTTFGFPFLTLEGGEGVELPTVGNHLAIGFQETSSLGFRAREIVCQLSAQHSLMLERGRGSQASFDEQLAEAVFTVANLKHFVWGFFHYFHPQFPILHQPTFNIQTVSLPLLLGVVLFGSMASNPSDLALSARQFFNVAEAYVFDHLVSVLQRSPTARNSDNDIEVLQANLLFTMFLNNSNDVAIRRRLRLHRLPAFVAAVRGSGLLAYKRRYLMDGRDKHDWHAFISDEVRVRLATWTFMTDSTLAVFFNSPSQVAVSEMIADLPCIEELFKAETSLEFERLALAQRSRPPGTTIPGLLSFIFSEPVYRSSTQKIGHITAVDMLLLVFALQSIVMTSRMNYLASTTAEVMLGAMDRWKSMWDAMNQDGEDGVVPHKGFERHAVDHWWLVRKILKVGQSGDLSCRYMRPVPSDFMKDLHDFVNKYKYYEG